MTNLDDFRQDVFSDGMDESLLVEVNGSLTRDQLVALARPFAVGEHEWHKFFGFTYIKEEAINNRLTSVMGSQWSKVVEERQYIPPQEPSVKIGDIDVTLSRAYPDGYTLYANGKKVMARPKVAARPNPSATLHEITNGIVDGELSFDIPGDTQTERPDPLAREVMFDIAVVMSHGYIEYNGVRRHSSGGDVLLNLGKEYNARLMNTYKGSDTDLLKRCARYWGVGLYLTQLSTVSYEVKEPGSLKRFLHEKYPHDKRYFEDKSAMKALFTAAALAHPELYRSGPDLKNQLDARGIVFNTDAYYAIEKLIVDG